MAQLPGNQRNARDGGDGVPRDVVLAPGMGESLDFGAGESVRARRKREGYSGALGKAGAQSSQPAEGSLFKEDLLVDEGPDYTYRRMRLHRNEEVDIYAEQRDRQTRMAPQKRACVLLGALLVVAYLAAVALPSDVFTVNASGMTLADWTEALQHRVAGFFSYITFQGGTYSMDWVANHYFIIALAGAALALSGAVYQGSLKNALASPSTLGVMTGANAGRIVYALCFYTTSYAGVSSMAHMSDIQAYYDSMDVSTYLFTLYGQSFCCLAGSAVVVVVVLAIAQASSKKGISNIVMIIAGQIMATLLGVIISLVQYYLTETGDSRIMLIREMQTDAFSNSYSRIDVLVSGIPIVLCMVGILALASRLNILAFSDDEARSMGVETTRLRWTMVGLCTVLTAVVVAFCGQVGMVGFFVPHLARRIVGPNLTYLLPASALLGALFLVVVYCALSMFSTTAATNIGVFTSVLGGILFLATAVRQGGGSHGDWT